MKVQMTGEELLSLYYVLSEEITKSNQKVDTRFSFAANMNIDSITPIAKRLAEAGNTKIEAFNQYIEERGQLLSKYAAKTPEGQPTIDNGRFLIPKESRQELNQFMVELDTKYAETLNGRKVEEKAYLELLKESLDIEIVKISFVYLPTWLNQRQSKTLRILIKESDNEIAELIGK